MHACYGMVWRGMVWYCVVWCGVVWCGMVHIYIFIHMMGEFLNEEREQADMVDEEGTDGGDINIEEYEADEAKDAKVEYPAWMNRIDFGSKVLPVEPCMLGDAQPELIKILLLQMGMNLLKMYKQFHRNFCGTFETAWQHFQMNQQFRLDLDPKVPTSVKMMMATSSSQVMNRCRISTIRSVDPSPRMMWERMASSMPITGHWSSRNCSPTFWSVDTSSTICKTCLVMSIPNHWRKVTPPRKRQGNPQQPVKPLIGNPHLSEEWSLVLTGWMPCISSGTWTSRTQRLSTQYTFCVPADHISVQSCIWFYRMASNSLDLYFFDCMMRSMIITSRRNAMINGRDGESTCRKPTWLPSPTRRYLKKLDVNLVHLRKVNQRQHQSQALLQAQNQRLRLQRFDRKLHLRRNKLQRPHFGKVGKTMEKVVEPTHTVAAIGTTQDTMEKETGDIIPRPLHRSWYDWRKDSDQCSWLNPSSMWMTSERNLSWLIREYHSFFLDTMLSRHHCIESWVSTAVYFSLSEEREGKTLAL